MIENINWTLIIAAIAAIMTSIAALIQVYSKVYVPRSKDKERKREEIYKPLLNDVNALIISIKKREKFREVFDWKTVEEKVSPKLFEKLKELFEVKADRWYKLLEHNREFVRFQCYFIANNSLENLPTEFKNLGAGNLGVVLYEAVGARILEGEKISLRWLEDNNPDLLETLKKCPSYKNIKNFMDWINVESPCLVYSKNAEEDLLQSAQKMISEVKSF